MNHTVDTVANRVEAIIESAIEVNGEVLSSTTDLVQEFLVDSLDALRIALQIEDHFGIEFSQNDLGKLRTVADIIAAVEAKVKE